MPGTFCSFHVVPVWLQIVHAFRMDEMAGLNSFVENGLMFRSIDCGGDDSMDAGFDQLIVVCSCFLLTMWFFAVPFVLADSV